MLPLSFFVVVIYAKAGGCSLEEKALVASTLLDPLNIVGYLIVDDDRSGRRKKKTSRPSLSSWFHDVEDPEPMDDFLGSPFWTETEGDTDEDRGSLLVELMAKVYQAPPLEFDERTIAPLGTGMSGAIDDKTVPPLLLEESAEEVHVEFVEASGDDDSSGGGDDEGLPTMVERFRVTSEENAWWKGGDDIQNDDFSGRRLKHDTNKINVAILHVSSQIGYEILDILLKENSETERMGGPKILLNSKGPAASAGTIFLWTLLSILMCSCACCSMLIFIDFVGEDNRPTPQRAVRRQLSSNQVRSNFPSFVYHPGNHVDQPLDDECAICLDDFEEGMHLKKLPCGHVFHSTCVARWLIERHAVCPLCKMDLFEEEEQPEEERVRVDNLQEQYGALASISRWWSNPVAVRTAGAATQPSGAGILTWWSSSPVTVPMASAETSALPTAPPTVAFRWGWTAPPTSETAAQASTSIPPRSSMWQSATQWLGSPRRSGTGSSGMVTELTEPLLVADTTDEGTAVSATGSSVIAGLAPGESGVAPSNPVETDTSISAPLEV